jgi:anti-anti-sigma factor
MRTANVMTVEAPPAADREACFLRLPASEYGSLETGKLAQLRCLLLHTAAHSPGRRLVLDLSNIQYVGAGFVGILVETWDELNKAGRLLTLCGLTPYCARLIRTLHLDKLFDNHPAQATGSERTRPHALCAEPLVPVGPVHVQLTEVAWNPDMVRKEYFGDDGEPVRNNLGGAEYYSSVHSPSQRRSPLE